MDDIGTRRELAEYRIGEAERCLEAAKLSLQHDDYKTSANRSYYCIFHAMRAVLATEDYDSKNIPALFPCFGRTISKQESSARISQK